MNSDNCSDGKQSSVDKKAEKLYRFYIGYFISLVGLLIFLVEILDYVPAANKVLGLIGFTICSIVNYIYYVKIANIVEG